MAPRFLWLWLILAAFSLAPAAVLAAPSLAITPITWDVVGLDSNNVNVGPNEFPVGARVCNTGSAATNLVGTFKWDSVNSYIGLNSGSLSSIAISTLPSGTSAAPACADFYYQVTVTRNVGAYNQARQYHIEFTSDDTGSTVYTTPIPRQIFVEHLISQNRNTIVGLKLDGNLIAAGGQLPLKVGNTYNITLLGKTATQGYNQLEAFIGLPRGPHVAATG